MVENGWKEKEKEKEKEEVASIIEESTKTSNIGGTNSREPATAPTTSPATQLVSQPASQPASQPTNQNVEFERQSGFSKAVHRSILVCTHTRVHAYPWLIRAHVHTFLYYDLQSDGRQRIRAFPLYASDASITSSTFECADCWKLTLNPVIADNTCSAVREMVSCKLLPGSTGYGKLFAIGNPMIIPRRLNLQTLEQAAKRLQLT
uniref:Uncharacterized protein n=1 Tax=Vespula pensylvanica TaxID=30213 RepID=A0A834PBH4_VESPE|nr:hypothetical protein H0235_002695 [Vespula pensylvanica]